MQLNHYLDWPTLAQVFSVQGTRCHTKVGQLTDEVVFGVTGITPQQCLPKRLLALILQYLYIENRLHYVHLIRHVTFHKDACMLRHPKRQHLLANLNHVVIDQLRQITFALVSQS